MQRAPEGSGHFHYSGPWPWLLRWANLGFYLCRPGHFILIYLQQQGIFLSILHILTLLILRRVL